MLFNKLTKLTVSLSVISAVILSSSAYAGYKRVDWNRFNMAYHNENNALMEKLVHIDESDIVDEVVKTKFTVKESSIEREVNNGYMMGIGFETGLLAPNNFFKKSTTELHPGYIDLAERMVDCPIFRLGGACSSSDSWITKIGEIGNRRVVGHRDNVAQYNGSIPGALGNYERANEIGPLEFHKITQAINPNCKYIITLPWYEYGKEDLVSIVRFYLDEADESEWGALRASMGIKDPIDVLCFEMGNELYCTEIEGYNNERTAKEYIKDVKEFIPAVKAVCPEAKFGVPLRGNHQAEADPSTYNNWNVWLAEGIGDLIDYACPHLYYCGYEPSYFMFWFQDQYKAFTDALGEDCNIKFLVTEHGRWFDKNDMKEFSTHSLDSVLAISQMYNLMYELPFIECSTYYGWYNSSWAIAKNKGENWLLMGIPSMMDIYLKNIGDAVVSSKIESETPYTDVNSTKRRFTGLTMKDGEDIVLFLTNRHPYVEFETEFEFENDYTLVEETVFTAPNIYSFVATKDTEDIFTTTVTEKNEENFSEYKVPGKSLVVLRLKKQK